MTALRRNIILIGSGPHYQKKYHSILEENNSQILFLIDLEKNKKSILHFFADKKLKPQQTLFLDDTFQHHITLNEIDTILARFPAISHADGVIISTEPKVRKPYVLWAAKHSLPLFMDKPISAFSDLHRSDTLLDDYEEIQTALIQGKSSAVVSCERRAHVGYLWVKKYIEDFISIMKTPITAIDIHFAGGIFTLPHEFEAVENHPFKYGYGILLHSGYHYIDALTQFLALNDSIIPSDQEIVLQTLVSRPNDKLQQGYKHNYAPLIDQKDVKYTIPNNLTQYGETDILLMGQSKNVTNFSVRLFGTSLSLRQEKKYNPRDQVPGKIRQESVIIHLGHHCSIHITSLPFKKIDPKTHTIEHFDITVLNSPSVKKYAPIIKVTREDLSAMYPNIDSGKSLNTYARQWQLKEFLLGNSGNSAFESHRNTVQFLHSIYSQFFQNLR